MKRRIVLFMAVLMAFSLCACGIGTKKEAAEASVLLSNTAWAGIVGEVFGDNTYHILVFTNGGNGSGDVEYAIQIGDTTTFDVRGKYTISADGIIKTSYEEQIKDGTWGAIDEGRVDQDRFQYVMSDGKITELYRVNDNGELTDRFYQLE